jgi:AhpD family alkylhydroperoxidase
MIVYWVINSVIVGPALLFSPSVDPVCSSVVAATAGAKIQR